MVAGGAVGGVITYGQKLLGGTKSVGKSAGKGVHGMGLAVQLVLWEH